MSKCSVTVAEETRLSSSIEAIENNLKGYDTVFVNSKQLSQLVKIKAYYETQRNRDTEYTINTPDYHCLKVSIPYIHGERAEVVNEVPPVVEGLLDEFALSAIQGTADSIFGSVEEIAETAYDIAEAMVKERQKRLGK